MQHNLITKAIINQGNVTSDSTLPTSSIASSALRLNQTTANIQLSLPPGIIGQTLTVYNNGTVPVYVGDVGTGYFTIGVNAGLEFYYSGLLWIPISLYPTYGTAGKTSTQVLLLAPTDITWTNFLGRGVGFNVNNGLNTTFTLPANRTYKMEALFTPTVAGVAYSIQWVDSSNSPIGTINLPAQGLASLSHVEAIAVFRPTVDTDVKLRHSGGIGVTLGTVSYVDINSRD